jgi:hypothetical protein
MTGSEWRVEKNRLSVERSSSGLCQRYSQSQCWCMRLTGHSSRRYPGLRLILIGAHIRHERTAGLALLPPGLELPQAGPGPFRAAESFARPSAFHQFPIAKPLSSWGRAAAVCAGSLCIASAGISISGGAVRTKISNGTPPALPPGGYGSRLGHNCNF